MSQIYSKAYIEVDYKDSALPLSDAQCKQFSKAILTAASNLVFGLDKNYYLPNNINLHFNEEDDSIRLQIETSNELLIGCLRAFWNVVKLDPSVFALTIFQNFHELNESYHSQINNEGRFMGPQIPLESLVDWYLGALCYGEDEKEPT